MGIRSTLKNVWKTLTEQYGPYSPAPEVKKKLEGLGYEFKMAVMGISHHGVTLCYDVYKDGKPVCTLFGNKGRIRQYQEDYERAVAECKAAKPPKTEPK